MSVEDRLRAGLPDSVAQGVSCWAEGANRFRLSAALFSFSECAAAAAKSPQVQAARAAASD